MNGILVIDKPRDWTSHDVVGKLRGLLHTRRIGHAGTLDPMATGVLPVFVGRATRAVEFCEGDDKEYLARLRLGVVTDTQDVTGTVLRDAGDPGLSAADVTAVLPRFTGDLLQVPPMYSAVKVNGQRLYALARKGREVARAPRPVTVRVLELLGADGRDFDLRVVCSKGTYVRTLCADLGEALGCGGTLAALRRTRAGRFTLDGAVTPEAVAAAAERGEAERLLAPVDTLFADLPAFAADARGERAARTGTPFAADVPDGRYRVYAPDGAFLLLGRAEAGRMRTVKSFFEVD